MVTLADVYAYYAGSHRGIDCLKFVTLCRDSGLFDERFKDSDAEVVFMQSMALARRRLDGVRLEEALRRIAERKGVQESSVHSMVLDTHRPLLQGSEVRAESPAKERKRHGSGSRTRAKHGRKEAASGSSAALPSAPLSALEFARCVFPEQQAQAEVKDVDEDGQGRGAQPCVVQPPEGRPQMMEVSSRDAARTPPPSPRERPRAGQRPLVCQLPSSYPLSTATFRPMSPPPPKKAPEALAAPQTTQADQAAAAADAMAQYAEDVALPAQASLAAPPSPGKVQHKPSMGPTMVVLPMRARQQVEAGVIDDFGVAPVFEQDDPRPCIAPEVVPPASPAQRNASILPSAGPTLVPLRPRARPRSASRIQAAAYLPEDPTSPKYPTRAVAAAAEGKERLDALASPSTEDTAEPTDSAADSAEDDARPRTPSRPQHLVHQRPSSNPGCMLHLSSVAQVPKLTTLPPGTFTDSSSPPRNIPCAVNETFKAFCMGGVDMDCKAFLKLCKRCCLFDKRFTSHDARLAFSEAILVGQSRMDLASFESALTHIATRRGLDPGLVRRMVAWYEPGSASEADPKGERHANTWSQGSTSTPAPVAEDDGETEMAGRDKRSSRAGARSVCRSGSMPCVGRFRPHMVAEPEPVVERQVAETMNSIAARGRRVAAFPLDDGTLEGELAKAYRANRARSLSSLTTQSGASPSPSSTPSSAAISPATWVKGAGFELNAEDLAELAGGRVFTPRGASEVRGLPPALVSMPLQRVLPGHPGHHGRSVVSTF